MSVETAIKTWELGTIISICAPQPQLDKEGLLVGYRKANKELSAVILKLTLNGMWNVAVVPFSEIRKNYTSSVEMVTFLVENLSQERKIYYNTVMGQAMKAYPLETAVSIDASMKEVAGWYIDFATQGISIYANPLSEIEFEPDLQENSLEFWLGQKIFDIGDFVTGITGEQSMIIGFKLDPALQEFMFIIGTEAGRDDAFEEELSYVKNDPDKRLLTKYEVLNNSLPSIVKDYPIGMGISRWVKKPENQGIVIGYAKVEDGKFMGVLYLDMTGKEQVVAAYGLDTGRPPAHTAYTHYTQPKPEPTFKTGKSPVNFAYSSGLPWICRF